MRPQIRERVITHPVVTFFLLTYAISWIAWLGPVLELSEPIGTLGFVVGGYGPFLAALVVTWLGSDSVRAWAHQIVDWRVAPRWYIAALTIPLLVIALTSVGLTAVGRSVDPGVLPGRFSLVLVSFLTIALIGGGNEEPGWRGLALPKLQEQYAPVPATVILGVVWALWHLPLLATGTTEFHGLASFVELAPTTAVRILNIVGVAFILTWIYNETGSVLLAILAHTGFNTANSTLVPLPLDVISAGDSTTILVVTTVAIWVVVAVLLVATGGQLGYEAETDAAPTPTPGQRLEGE
ncbi:type II CAAX endopeptidase family protein [Haloferax sulfurifontis]|uniref:type II CAAX endopeptidase family protein n=1 Tax=Haloferax sulfurifontis TaxID=255616 RepID=UPI0018732A97|nr:type II CAAX endopeptidase family protein [Haloferax sulfurifontis]